MSAVHRIALKGPWYYEWLGELAAGRGTQSGNRNPDNIAAAVPEPDVRRVRMPSDWESLFGSQSGRVRFSRRFHCPTGLDSETRVFVSFTGLGGRGSVLLNQQFLGGVHQCREPVCFDVTALLEPSNMLEVVLEYCPDTDGSPGGIWGTVYVEIH